MNNESIANGEGAQPTNVQANNQQNYGLKKVLLFGLGGLVFLILLFFLFYWGFSKYWQTDSDFVFYNIVITVASFVVSFLFGLGLLEGNFSMGNIIKLFRDSFFASLLSSLFISCVSMLYTVDKIDSYFKKDGDLYTRVIKKIDESGSKSDTRRVVLSQKLNLLKSELSSLDADYFSIPENEILNYWETLVNNSKKSFLAINIIPDWSKVSRDNTGIQRQTEALKKGVNIRRIYMFGNDCPKEDTNCEENIYTGSMRTLFNTQKKLTELSFAGKFIQYEIKKNELRENPRYKIFRNKLGTDDIVIVDGEIVLLTFVDEKFQMQSAKISFQPDIVEAAKQLFDLLERDLTSINGNNTQSTNKSISNKQ
jgi:hypothetical protein